MYIINYVNLKLNIKVTVIMLLQISTRINLGHIFVRTAFTVSNDAKL